jgi:hypothetical protein
MRATPLRVAVLGLPVMLAVSCGGNPTSKMKPLPSCCFYQTGLCLRIEWSKHRYGFDVHGQLLHRRSDSDDTGHCHNRNQVIDGQSGRKP